jgi:DNA repair protein RadA/Sms
VEIQSLVSENTFGIPRRTTIGVDHHRVSLLAAVLDRVCGFHLGNHDIFINVAGGIKLDEPAVDLGIVSSMISSFLDRPIDAATVVCGEVGLTGEVRGVNQLVSRIREAGRMGFTRCVLPRIPLSDIASKENVELIEIATVKELLDCLF